MQSIEIDPEPTQMLVWTDKDIKRYYHCIPCVQEVTHMEDTKKDTNHTYKDEKPQTSEMKNVLDEIHGR